MSIINKSSNKKSGKNAEKFAEDLKKVLKKFKETKLGEYDNINLDYYKTFVKKKSNFTDKFSVMDECISKLKIAVKEFDNVCTKFTKTFSEGGLLSISNIYLKKISSGAKQFYRDLVRLESAENKKICQENMKKFSKSNNSLRKFIFGAAECKVNGVRNSAKIQDEKVKNLMSEIADYLGKFPAVYANYTSECFTD